MPSSPEFRRLLRAVKRGNVLSDRETTAKDAPPSYAAHMLLDGNEYTVSVTPTKLERIQEVLEGSPE